MITIEQHYNKAGDAGDKFVCYGIMGSLKNLIQEIAEHLGDTEAVTTLEILHDHIDTMQEQVAQRMIDDYERKYCTNCKDEEDKPLEMEYQATRCNGDGHTMWICKKCGKDM